jgi:hypothetical protein
VSVSHPAVLDLPWVRLRRRRDAMDASCRETRSPRRPIPPAMAQVIEQAFECMP